MIFHTILFIFLVAQQISFSKRRYDAISSSNFHPTPLQRSISTSSGIFEHNGTYSSGSGKSLHGKITHSILFFILQSKNHSSLYSTRRNTPKLVTSGGVRRRDLAPEQWAIPLQRNIAALVMLSDMTCPKIEHRTSRAGSDVFNHFADRLYCEVILTSLFLSFSQNAMETFVSD